MALVLQPAHWPHRLESETIGIPIFTLLSVPWVLALGLLLLSGRPLIRAYVISEVTLSAPNLLFVLRVFAVNMSPAHGFSVGELPPVVCVMIIFSVIPLILAYYADRSLGGLLAGAARSNVAVE